MLVFYSDEEFCLASKKANKVRPHRQLWDADERRRRRCWVSFLTTVKDVLPVVPTLSICGFLPAFPCEPWEWEIVCIHEDQLEGIPISTVGFFPSVVLFSAEGTVLFRLSECASSFPLCVCVCVYLGLHYHTRCLTSATLSNTHSFNITANTCAHICISVYRQTKAHWFYQITTSVVNTYKQYFLLTGAMPSCLHKKITAVLILAPSREGKQV